MWGSIGTGPFAIEAEIQGQSPMAHTFLSHLKLYYFIPLTV